jgi:hypothetical protein
MELLNNEQLMINLNYRPKWGYRLLIFICIYIFYYFFANVSIKLPYSYYEISFGISAILAGLHFIFINRITLNMFATKYRQYGFFVIVYYLLTVAGMAGHQKAATKFKDYILSNPEVSQTCEHKLNDYFLSHQRPDIIQDDDAFNILRGVVSKFPEGNNFVKRLWDYGIYWNTSLWLLITFLVMYIESRIRFYLKTKKLFGIISNKGKKTVIGKIIDHGRLVIGFAAMWGIKILSYAILYSSDLRLLALYLSGFLLLIILMTIPGWVYDRIQSRFFKDQSPA